MSQAPTVTAAFKQQTDEQLARAAITDPDAFAVLMHRYEAKLLRYIRRLGVALNDLEDVLQEAFLRMYKHLTSFNPSLSFSAWAYRITHNQAVSWLRKHKKPEQQSTVSLDQETEDGLKLLDRLESENSIEQDAQRADLALNVRKAVYALPQKYKDVLVLYYLESKTYDEISDILKKPSGTVATHVRRAKSKLLDACRQQGIQKEDLTL